MQIAHYVSRGFWVSPLVAAALILSRPAPEFLVVAAETGGQLVVVRTAASITVAIYAAFLFYGLGRLIVNQFDRSVGGQPFFVIYLLGLLPVYFIGLILGLLRLNNAYFNAIIFTAAHLVLWPYIRPAFKEAIRWITVEGPTSQSLHSKQFVIATRLCVPFALAIVLLFVICPLDLIRNDVIQYYYGYFRDVRYLGGVGFDPFEPRIADVLAARGLGLHHFLTSFTDEFFIRFISFLLLIPLPSVFGMVLRPYMVSSLAASETLIAVATEFVALVMVIVVACVPEPGKYHLFNAVLFLTVISLGARMAAHSDRASRSETILFLALFAIVPIVLTYNLVLLFVLMAALFVVGITQRGDLLRNVLIASTIIAISAVISLLYNYITLGVLDLFPLWLMTHFSRPDILAQWTDPANYIYTNAMAGIHPFRSEFIVGKGAILVAHIILYIFISILLERKFLHLEDYAASVTSTKHNPPTIKYLLDGVFILGFIYFSFDLLLSSSGHSSLQRMLYYFPVLQLQYIICAGAFLFAAARASRLVPNAILSYGRVFLFLVMVAGGTVVLGKTIREDFYYLDWSAMRHTGRWLVGAEGALAGPYAQNFDFNRCRQIDRALPPGARILPLNGVVLLTPCMFSPSIERGRFIHIYESVVSRFFSILLFGRPSEQEAIYKRVGIDYFLFVINDSEFYGPAYGNLFSSKFLSERFQVYSATDDYVILTWRTAAVPQLDSKLVASIELARRLEMTIRQSFRYSDAIFDTWDAVRGSCGPTCSLPITVNFNKKIPAEEGTPIGNLTGFRGLAASFDGTLKKIATSCSAPPGGVRAPASRGYNNFIGKDWGAGASRKITGFKLLPPTDQGMMQSAAMDLKLQGSNDNLTWTDLYAGTGLAPGGPEHLTVAIGIDSSAAYRFHRVNIQGNGVNALAVCQLQFFTENTDSVLP